MEKNRRDLTLAEIEREIAAIVSSFTMLCDSDHRVASPDYEKYNKLFRAVRIAQELAQRVDDLETSTADALAIEREGFCSHFVLARATGEREFHRRVASRRENRSFERIKKLKQLLGDDYETKD